MSVSAVSIAANPSTATRRRALEKKPVEFADTNNYSTAATAAAAAATTVDYARLAVNEDETTRDAVVQVKKTLPSNFSTRRPWNTARKPVSKHEKPKWKTVISIFVKNFLLLAFLLGCVQSVKKFLVGSGSRNPGRTSEDMQKYVESMTKTMKMMQVQVDVIDKKIGEEMGKVKNEVNEKMKGKSIDFEKNLKKLDGRTMNLEQFRDQLSGKMEKFLSEDELNEFLEEFKKGKTKDILNLDEIRVFAKGIVEKELDKHAADGIGKVDYALASGGAMVVKHSEPFVGGKGIGMSLISLANWLQELKEAEKMLRPSFGEPGQCFALKGSAGFVDIKLRNAIIPEAITLEHVSKAVAYDRSSAPKHCKVSGWLQTKDISESVVDPVEVTFLTEFTYEIGKSNVQTFDVVDSDHSNLVDTIRFEIISNHGSSTHTCIYRLRVHGQEPTSDLFFNTES